MIKQTVSRLPVVALPSGQAQPDRETLPIDTAWILIVSPPRERPRQ